MKIYVDGKFYEENDAKISVFDHGLLYGDGVFEGIRSYNGRILHLKDHIARLYNSAKAILLDINISEDEMQRIICEAVRINKLQDSYIRVLVTRGIGDLGLDMRKCPTPTIIVIADKIQLFPEEVYQRGLNIMVSHLRRMGPDQLSPTVKSLNYLNNILARAEAARSNCDEALLLNEQGYVAECSGDNIFFIRDGKLFTPPVWAGILEGVTRNLAMMLAQTKLGMKITEEVFTVPELYRAQEVFVTGTGAEVIGVVSINGRTISNGKPGPITQKLIKTYREYVRSPQAGVPVYEEVQV